jgi:hypothetical protein
MQDNSSDFSTMEETAKELKAMGRDTMADQFPGIFGLDNHKIVIIKLA